MIDIIYHDGASAAPDQAGQSGGFAQADGNGEIHCYSWLDGVSAMLMRLEMESYTELRTQKGLLELNFCANGRFETRFSLRDHVLLKPGDMAISCYDGVHGSRSESHFPLGYYEGICLEVDPERARRWVERNAPAFRVDFSALQQNLLGDKWYRCSPAGPRCEHVFRELYESAAYLDPAFLRLKVLELLMLLSSIPRGAGTDAYCSARQAELIASLAGAEDQGEGYGVLGNVPLVFLLGGEIRADGLCDLDLPAVVQGEGARPGEQAQGEGQGHGGRGTENQLIVLPPDKQIVWQVQGGRRGGAGGQGQDLFQMDGGNLEAVHLGQELLHRPHRHGVGQRGQGPGGEGDPPLGHHRGLGGLFRHGVEKVPVLPQGADTLVHVPPLPFFLSKVQYR